MINDLPTYPNSFIGRKYHLHAIESLIQSEDKRLITLLGPGGIGKTRLSVKAGEHLAAKFQDGVCFVALDAVTEPEQVPLYIGHRLGLKTAFNSSWMETITAYLEDKELLLILDNLEQILDSADTIDQILDSCTQVKILVTSREILGLPQEVEYPLDSLNRPNPRLCPSPEDLTKFDAVNLFVQKARSSRPDFQLNDDNAVAVVEICQELDGLPLPIELAAARIKLFSPTLILSKLKKNTDLLKTRSRRVSNRHRNIRNTIQWSYDLLEEQEQKIFQQLAIFRGGFSPEALDAVCIDQDALEVIESFINKSLIVKDKEVYDVPRFRMLKLIRDFGLEHLHHNPEKENYYLQFTRYYIQYVERLNAELRDTDIVRWLALLEAEYENLQVAMEWLIGHQPEQAGQLGSNLWRFYLFRGFLREGLDLIHKLLALPLEDASVKSRLLEGAGTLSHNQGDYLQARENFADCLQFWENVGSTEKIINALNNLAWSEWRIGRYDQTVSYSERALSLSRGTGDLRGYAKSLNNLAWVYFHRGIYEKAEELQHQILQCQMEMDNLRGIAFAKTNLAWANIRTGNLQQAEQRISESIPDFRDQMASQLLTFSQFIKAELLSVSGDPTAARSLIEEECLPGFERIGDVWAFIRTNILLGQLYFAEQALESARHHLQRARELSYEVQDQYSQTLSGIWLNKVARVRGEQGTTEASLKECLKLATEMKAQDLLKSTFLEIGLQEMNRKLYPSAIRNFTAAACFAKKTGNYQRERFWADVAPYLSELKAILPAEGQELNGIQPEPAWPVGEVEFGESLKGLISRIREAAPSSPSSVAVKQDTEKDLPDEPVHKDPFYRQVRELIEKNLDNPDFTVKQLCLELGMSHSHLHRKINKLTGQSAGKFIRSIRLAKAKTLLLDPEQTITAVAYDTGFRDTDYFFRVFKQVFDMTPGEFRKDNASDNSIH